MRPVVLVEPAPAELRQVAEQGHRPIVVRRPGRRLDGLVHPSGELYTIDLDDQAEWAGFVDQVLAPLAPESVEAGTDPRGAAAIAERLGLPVAGSRTATALDPAPVLGTRTGLDAGTGPPPQRPFGRAGKPRVLFIHRHSYRWLFRGERCLAPVTDAEIYLVSHPFLGIEQVDPALFPRVAVANFVDEDELWRLCGWVIRSQRIEAVLAVHEKMMMFAARLREAFELPGADLATTTGYRDKLSMKDRLRSAGKVIVPDYRAVDRAGDLEELSWPAPRILKSRWGLGASEVHKVSDLDSARRQFDQIAPAEGQYEIEDFVEGPMLHCDSVVVDGKPVFVNVSKYINTCADYELDGVLGSYTADDELRAAALKVNAQVLEALPLAAGSTHLELFQRPDGELVFCEIAGRPPGGGIDNMIEQGYGISLIEAALRLQSGLPVQQLPPEVATGEHPPVAWLGFYPTASARAGVTPAEYDQHHIVYAQSYDNAGDGRGGVRHATDVAWLYLVAAETPTALSEHIDGVITAYGSS